MKNILSYLSWQTIIVIVIAFIIVTAYSIYSEIEFRKRMVRISDATEGLTPKEFFALRKRHDRKSLKTYRRRFGSEGVYILHNTDKDMYYVGQGKNFTNRVNSHFTGSGNGDVYADYKYNDEFTIKLIYLSRTGYDNLNDLERDMITHYNSFHKGYNKTRGNKS